MPALLVILLGAVIVIAGFLTVTRRNPVHAAVSMLVSLAGVALLMLGVRAPFLAAMQILLYAGAIMVLFVFVIMLLTLKEEELGPEPSDRQKAIAALGAFGLLCVLGFAIASRGTVQFQEPFLEAEEARIAASTGREVPRGEHVGTGTTEHFARFLYTDYALPFELLTVLVMAAVTGVIVLARRPDRPTLAGTRLTGGEA